jgi:hypothetical protein
MVWKISITFMSKIWFSFQKVVSQEILWHVPNSFTNLNVNLKQKTTEEQGVGAHSLAHNTLEG